jgi:hypothetical protein
MFAKAGRLIEWAITSSHNKNEKYVFIIHLYKKYCFKPCYTCVACANTYFITNPSQQFIDMKKRNSLLAKAALSAFFCMVFLTGIAQKGTSLLKLNVPVQYAWYKINVTVGVTELKGIKRNHSINAGANIGYEYFLTDRLSAEAGFGIFATAFNIVRSYDRRFLGDLQAINTVTYPRYKYSIVQIPLGINYLLSKKGKFKYFLGLCKYFNVTFHQQYAPDGALNKVYLFSNAVELNTRIQFTAGSKISLAVKPALQVYNQWKKDVVVYDYGAGVVEPPKSEPRYYKQFFDAVSITFSVAYKF